MSTSYLAHPGRVTRLRDGVVEVHPESATAAQTVWVAVYPGGEDEVAWEGLRAHPSGEGRAVVAAVPVFAYDLHLGDEVEVVATAEGPLVAVRPLLDAGRHTYRVWFPDWPDLERDERGRELQVELARFGCWFDVYSPHLVAISAEPDVAAAVADHLDEAERAGRFIYEVGRTP
ncbi:DUF4265 domain-containing protein [Blastococcus xanthinilyticus]|uniref:Uncharacterized protein DUF4265 n=1 Tax=Blastococcus xanthinilyticus TaxID=1564164 RepID=A0A5S5CME2_9ACTN|nr:DUF4265 domain-containing protein [Blastococcus xanthinilyticus]TYP82898.1 uncharacterized protein DUF4265 [Blastococcus xanthinilyticus]